MLNGGVLDDVTAALREADTVDDACRRTVDALARHSGAMTCALLHVHDHLRCVAAAGAWSVFSSLPADAGIAGQVYQTGQILTRTVAGEGDSVSPGAPALTEICVPLPGPDGQPVGALDLEWTDGAEIEAWRPVLVEAGRRLGGRIGALGGPPAESSGEQLLRHALGMTNAAGERELLERSLAAAREVSGLSTALVVLGPRAYLDPAARTGLGARLMALDPAVLARIAARVRRHGGSYTLGDPGRLDAPGFEVLTAAGVRSMITVPVGPPGDERGGILLLVDEGIRHPNAEIVNLLELLAAQAWTSVDRLRTLRLLRERATSDPLTGLRHHGPFGERLAGAVPGRTALLAIDVDRFKHINDTYGHEAGDRALVDLARTLQTALRSQDELYRIGGDEFAAVVEVQRLEEATGVAQRLVTAARLVGYPISVGVAMQAEGEPPKQTLRRADMALYQVKQAGRDGVRVAPSRPGTGVA
ncbi:MAG TPA: sensor domain-containing diguanylate cyclase [Rugosimonospora sp.]|nr:sensor domain-containing diguanylate cyclase [Rugosimonospora sp.]